MKGAKDKAKEQIAKGLIFLAIAMVLITVAVTGASCNRAEKPVDEVVMQIKWFHQANSAGFYVADQKGFYNDSNIDITFLAGGSGIKYTEIMDDLTSGRTDFATVNPEHVVVARAEGIPIVAIATVFQKNPLVYVTLKGSGIRQPQDLVGKRVMVGEVSRLQHLLVLSNLGIDPDTVEVVPREEGVQPLIAGDIDALTAYRFSRVLEFEEAGYDINIIWLDDYGVHVTGDVIITTEQLVEQEPELIERFLRATFEGWRYAVENPGDAADMILQYDAALDRDHQLRMMMAEIPLLHSDEGQIGWMEDRKWQLMHDILLDNDILPHPIEVSGMYTMQFLKTIYGKAE